MKRFSFYASLTLIFSLILLTACSYPGANELPTPENAQPENTDNEAPDDLEFTEDEVAEEDASDSETPDEVEFTEDEGQLVGQSDNCLLGVWKLQNDSLVNYLDQAMNISPEVTFDISVLSGEIFYSFEESEVYAFTGSPVSVLVDVYASDINLSTVTLDVTADGTADWAAKDGILFVHDPAYDASGEGAADLIPINDLAGGADLSVEFSPSSFSSTATIKDEEAEVMKELGVEGDASSAYYVCNEQTFEMSFGEFGPMTFERE